MTERIHFIIRWNKEESQPSWRELLKFLEKQTEEKKLLPTAFVLMGTHFHLLSRGVPQLELSSESFDFEICLSEVIHPKYALHTYRYIYQNPMRAGLCRLVENYPYHSLSPVGAKLQKVLLKERASLLPYHLQSSRAELSWLNGTQSLHLPNSYS